MTKVCLEKIIKTADLSDYEKIKLAWGIVMGVYLKNADDNLTQPLSDMLSTINNKELYK